MRFENLIRLILGQDKMHQHIRSWPMAVFCSLGQDTMFLGEDRQTTYGQTTISIFDDHYHRYYNCQKLICVVSEI